MQRTLFIMAKQPQPGQTKTRLCPPLTATEACGLYACFLQDVVSTCRSITTRVAGLEAGIAYVPSTAALAYFRGLAPDFTLVKQRGADLAARLDGVLREALATGSSQVVAINSDGPTLPDSLLARAYHQLDDPKTDMVLGPCEDGGYYLIGVKGEFGDVVHGVQMSTPFVLRDTLAAAAAAGLEVALLPEWYDVDDRVALLRLQRELTRMPATVAPATRRFLAGLPLGKASGEAARLETDSGNG